MKKIVVLYHNNCPDGFGAAWAAWKKFGSRASYIGVNNGEAPPTSLKNKEVYILDIGFSDDQMRKLRASTQKLIMLDHHITRKESITLAHEYIFDLKRSGAGIAWNYFHPTRLLPYLLKIIQDYDLWRFRLPYTKELSAFLDINNQDFHLWNTLAKNFEKLKVRKKYIEAGSTLRAYQKKIIEKAVEKPQLVRFVGHIILAVNSFMLISEIGNALASKQPPFGLVWSERDGKIVVSLRSRDNFDVSKIAQKFGGGGHRQAAGFRFSAGKKFPWRPIKK